MLLLMTVIIASVTGVLITTALVTSSGEIGTTVVRTFGITADYAGRGCVELALLDIYNDIDTNISGSGNNCTYIITRNLDETSTIVSTGTVDTTTLIKTVNVATSGVRLEIISYN